MFMQAYFFSCRMFKHFYDIANILKDTKMISVHTYEFLKTEHICVTCTQIKNK